MHVVSYDHHLKTKSTFSHVDPWSSGTSSIKVFAKVWLICSLCLPCTWTYTVGAHNLMGVVSLQCGHEKMKSSSGGFGSILVKFCTSKNFMLYSTSLSFPYTCSNRIQTFTCKYVHVFGSLTHFYTSCKISSTQIAVVYSKFAHTCTQYLSRLSNEFHN